MKKCIKCGLAISDTAIKCPYCGAEQQKMNFCPKCGKPLVDSNAKFCNACGYIFKSVPNPTLRWQNLVLPFVTFVAIVISIITWNPKSPTPRIEKKCQQQSHKQLKHKQLKHKQLKHKQLKKLLLVHLYLARNAVISAILLRYVIQLVLEIIIQSV